MGDGNIRNIIKFIKLETRFSITNRILVLILSLSQIVTILILQIYVENSFGNEASSPIITPAGYAFTIWALIIIGSVLYGFYQVLPSTYGKRLFDKIAFPVDIVFLGFDLWLMVAIQNWLLFTIFVFLLMGIGLYNVFVPLQQAYKKRQLTKIETVFAYGTFGIYAGWTTVAVFANIASAIKYYGLQDVGVEGLLWQGVILVLATVTAQFLLVKFQYSLPYYGAILWAFVAIGVSTISSGKHVLPLTILVAFAILSFILVKSRTKL